MTASGSQNVMYAPPAMSNATVIDLAKAGGQDYWQFSPNQDVIFINSAHTTIDLPRIQISGGHNVEVLGLDMQTQPGQTGALEFYGLTGTAYVDGVHLDMSKAAGTDGIDIAGGNNGAGVNLIVQNSSIENVNGAFSGGQKDGGNGHADGIQMQGPVGGEIDVYNTHITTNYQGVFIAPQYSVEPSAAHLTNVDLHYTSPTSNDGRSSSYLLWTLDNTSERAYPISFNNVFVEPRPG